MPRFRALCLERSTGKQVVRLVEAADAEGAAQALIAAGWMVGTVVEVGEGGATKPGEGDRGGRGALKAAPPARAGRRGSWLGEFFAFRVLILPWVVRAGFALATVIAVVSTVISVIAFSGDFFRYGQAPSLPDVWAFVLILATIWGTWFAWRIAGELLVVLFRLHERAAAIERNTAGLAVKTRATVCGGCGYDLRGLEGGICPECGGRV